MSKYTDTEILDWLDKHTKDELNNPCWLQERCFGYEDCTSLREWAIKDMELNSKKPFVGDCDHTKYD